MSIGEFFTGGLNTEEDTLLYQKIKEADDDYNAVLLNTGQLCIIAARTFTDFEKVEVTFNIKPTE